MFSWLTRLRYHVVIFAKLLLTSGASDDISPCILWEASQTDWHICIFTFLAFSPTFLARRYPHWLRVCDTFSALFHVSSYFCWLLAEVWACSLRPHLYLGRISTSCSASWSPPPQHHHPPPLRQVPTRWNFLLRQTNLSPLSLTHSPLI